MEMVAEQTSKKEEKQVIVNCRIRDYNCFVLKDFMDFPKNTHDYSLGMN